MMMMKALKVEKKNQKNFWSVKGKGTGNRSLVKRFTKKADNIPYHIDNLCVFVITTLSLMKNIKVVARSKNVASKNGEILIWLDIKL